MMMSSSYRRALVEEVRRASPADEHDRLLAAVGKSALALLHLLREFALEAGELRTAALRQALEREAAAFDPPTRAGDVERALERVLAAAERYLEAQKRYLAAREDEITKLVALLSEALEGVTESNQQFHQGLLSRFRQVEGVAQLQDLREVRRMLGEQLRGLKAAVRAKSERDSRQAAGLREKVARLEGRLREAEQRAQTDPATGVPNRRALDAHLQMLVSRGGFRQVVFSVAMCDLDGLKAINDEHGHRIGDRAILALAQALREGVRKNDFIARYGGDEFVVVLTGLAHRQAEKRVSSLLHRLQKAVYYFERDGERLTLHLNASFGVSVFHPGDTPQSLIDRADEALYRAKQAGKARVCMEQ